MVKTTQQENKERYLCEECGFRYKEKKWAEKCEAWCREHQSCNMEITAHGTPPKDTTKGDETLKGENRKLLTKLLYGLTGVVSSLVFFLVLYWVLRLDSSITNERENHSLEAKRGGKDIEVIAQDLDIPWEVAFLTRLAESRQGSNKNRGSWS